MLGETVCKPMDAPPITTVWVVRFTILEKEIIFQMKKYIIEGGLSKEKEELF